MACRFRFEEACLDEKLYSLNNITIFHKLVLCYPPVYCSEDILRKRLNTLSDFGVEYLVNYGDYKLYGYHVLGKGYSAIVSLCIHDGIPRILKVRRLDSRRKGLEAEAIFLEYLEPFELSPKIYSWSKDLIIMEYVDGTPLPIFIENNLDKIDHVRRVLRKLLVKAFILDSLGIDHGELNRPGSHVLIKANEVVFLDFESASASRKPRNLTSLASYLFLRSRFKEKILCDEYSKEDIISRLRLYKDRISGFSLRKILKLIKC